MWIPPGSEIILEFTFVNHLQKDFCLTINSLKKIAYFSYILFFISN